MCMCVGEGSVVGENRVANQQKREKDSSASSYKIPIDGSEY